MYRKIKAGSTSQTIPIVIDDSSSATGAGLASLAHNSSGLVAKYRREGQASWTTISLVTAAAGTFTSGGFIESSSGAGGEYELGLPDAALASGAKWAAIVLYGATNMLPCRIMIELDAINYQATIQSEADAALAAYDPPTKAEQDAAFTEIKGATWASGTDTLEAIRDRGDAAWTTGGGGGGGDATLANQTTIIGYLTSAVPASAGGSSPGSPPDLTIKRHTDWIETLTFNVDITGWTKVWVTCKDAADIDGDDDTESYFQIVATPPSTSSLTYLNQALAETDSDGALTVLNASTGQIQIELKNAATTALVASTRKYEVKWMNASSEARLLSGEGDLRISNTVTKSAS